MNIIYYVYRHIRLDLNQPFYIGIGHIDLDKTSYYKRAYSKVHRNTYWKNIVNISAYEVEIIYETISKKLVLEKEIEFINLYGRKDLETGCLCNMTDGGEGSFTYNPILSFAQSERMKGNKRRKGLQHNKTDKEKISNSLKDYFSSEKSIEERKRRSDAAKVNNKKGRPGNKIKIIQLDSNENVLRIWDSSKDAAKELNVSSTSITKCCRLEKGTIKGYKWKYYDTKRRNNR